MRKWLPQPMRHRQGFVQGLCWENTDFAGGIPRLEMMNILLWTYIKFKTTVFFGSRFSTVTLFWLNLCYWHIFPHDMFIIVFASQRSSQLTVNRFSKIWVFTSSYTKCIINTYNKVIVFWQHTFSIDLSWVVFSMKMKNALLILNFPKWTFL